MDDRMPDRIGKYTITGIAGRGAMGVVYIGHDPLLDRKVAIKMATYGDIGDDQSAHQAYKMFLNEAQTAGGLDHTHILKVYDAGEMDNGMYMVMEYVDGADTLKSFIEPGKLLPIEAVVGYFRQCADALDYAHGRGVVHRDIKPANLMLTREGKVKIGDFGIARRVQADQTQVMGWFGSPMYMSPEQARDEDITGQSDLFSLGAVMYELLCGSPPFVARGMSGLIHKVLHEEPKPLRDRRSEVPEPLAAIVHRCLQKSRDQRYQTGAEIVRDLDAFLAGGEIGAEPSAEGKLELLKALSFFEGYSPAMIKEVLKVAQWKVFPTEAVLIREGYQEPGFFIIVDGQLSVLRDDQAIGAVQGGECVGEIEYLAGLKRTVTVKALTKVKALFIEAKLTEWASLPLQMRLNRSFQSVLINHLIQAYERLTRRKA